MSRRKTQTGILRTAFLVLLTVSLFAADTFQFKRSQTIYVLAARDSRLFTMCPTEAEVRLRSGKTWKSDGNVAVHYSDDDSESINFFDTAASLGTPSSIVYPTLMVTLPLPASRLSSGAASDLGVPGRIELNRVALDPQIRSRVEKEFQKHKEFVLVDSPQKADFVFLAEGTYLPMTTWEVGRSGVSVLPRGDYKAGFLQAVLAIVAPAAVFNPGAVDSAALMDARLWEGSAVWQNTKAHNDPNAGPEFVAASPEALVRQFLNKDKRPPSHFPLCAASAQTLALQRIGHEVSRIQPNLKERSAPQPAASPLDQQSSSNNKAIKVDVTLVTVPVIISDRDGKYVSDLEASDFRIFEDEREQKIDRIIPEAEPFSVTLMVDTSSSMRFKNEEVQNSALAFIDTAGPADRLMIVSFGSRVFIHSEFTADRSRLRSAAYSMRAGEGTRLYDALDLILMDRLNGIQGRKAIVLMTDGVDTRSLLADSAGTLAAVEESNVLVYAIQYDTRSENKLRPPADASGWMIVPEDARQNDERYARADKFLYSLSVASGGELFLAETITNLKGVFAHIADELRFQYMLCYYPQNQNRDGSFHKIRVEVDRPGVTIRARVGYRAAMQSTSGK
ncbi:MAG: VWA domain-containing protein [Acidobacteriota bacterium]|jgi:VWFA-related protein